MAENCDEELLDDLLINPSALAPLLLFAFILLWFWYLWGDFIVFGGVGDWCLTNSHTVIATCTIPFPSKTSAAQHRRFWNEIFEREKARKLLDFAIILFCKCKSNLFQREKSSNRGEKVDAWVDGIKMGVNRMIIQTVAKIIFYLVIFLIHKHLKHRKITNSFSCLGFVFIHY